MDAVEDALDDAPPVSAQELLERAARLGPSRPTLQSIVLPNDPVLAEKMTPRAAERRARLRKVVNATVAACAALCVAALIATALSPSPAAASSGERASTATHAAPSIRVVAIEKLDETTLTKATHHGATTTATAKMRPKHGKRR